MTAHTAAQSFVAVAPAAWPLTHTLRPQPLPGLDLQGPTLSFGRDEEVFGEGEPADHVYRVVSGAVRTFRVLADGRRQICEFHLPGDCLGFEPSAAHRTSAEAMGETRLVSVRRSALLDGADTAPDVARMLWRSAVADLQRSQDHVLRLGHRSASERVASFLLEVAGRLGGADRFDLPMSRQDIADYLGLTIETVSRSFTHLQSLGLIEVRACRSIRLSNRQALVDLCE